MNCDDCKQGLCDDCYESDCECNLSGHLGFYDDKACSDCGHLGDEHSVDGECFRCECDAYHWHEGCND